MLLIDGDPQGRHLSTLLADAFSQSPPSETRIRLAHPAEGLTLAVPEPDKAQDPGRYSEAIATLVADRRSNAEIVIIDGPILSGAADELMSEAEIGTVFLALPFGEVSLSAMEQMLDRNPGGKRADRRGFPDQYSSSAVDQP